MEELAAANKKINRLFIHYYFKLQVMGTQRSNSLIIITLLFKVEKKDKTQPTIQQQHQFTI